MRKLIGLVLSLALVACVPSNVRAQENSFAYNPTCANAVVASCQFKTAGGQLIALHVANWTASALVVMLVDTATVPTTTAAACTATQITNNTCNFIRAYPIASGGAAAPTYLDLSFLPSALLFQNGLVVLCSSTGLSGGVMTYTASANCTFDAETH